MTTAKKRFLIGFIWLFSAIAAFVGGVYFRIAYYVFPSAVRSYSVKVDGPTSQDGILYSTKAFAEANKVAESLISSSRRGERNFDPRVIVTPAYYGYTVTYSSGSPVVEFPEDLLKSVKDTVSDVLNNDLRNRVNHKENENQ